MPHLIFSAQRYLQQCVVAMIHVSDRSQLSTLLTFWTDIGKSTGRFCTSLLFSLRTSFPGTGARGGGKHSRVCPGRCAGRSSCLIIERSKFDTQQSCSAKPCESCGNVVDLPQSVHREPRDVVLLACLKAEDERY